MITLNYLGKQFVNCDKEDLIKQGVPEGVILQAESAEILALRKAAFIAESDPLYMEWQYDQTPEKEQAWRDKVAEIKARHPLPTES